MVLSVSDGDNAGGGVKHGLENVQDTAQEI